MVDSLLLRVRWRNLPTSFCDSYASRSWPTSGRGCGAYREELAAVRLELARVRRAVERPNSVVSSPSRAVGGSDIGSVAGYTGAVSEVPADVSVRSLGSSVASSAPTGVTDPHQQPVVQTWEQRERIAEGIGHFFRRALAGDHRGTSGREALRLSSRPWIVVRSIRGEVFSPVRIFRNWARAKDLVKIGSSAGDSIFVGVPSEREARVVVVASGLEYPEVIEG